MSVGQFPLGFGPKVGAATWQCLVQTYQAGSAQAWETWGIFRYTEKTVSIIWTGLVIIFGSAALEQSIRQYHMRNI